MSRPSEDELRAILRSHDADAPTREVLHVPSPRHLGWLPGVAAAAVVLAVATTVAVVADRGSGDPAARPTASQSDTGAPAPLSATSPLRCPAGVTGDHARQQVPAAPRGIATAGRLTPDRAPRSVLLCGWVRRNGATVASQRVLTGSPAELTAALALAPEVRDSACATYQTDADTFLIGLTYSAGTVWVAAPGQHCDGASNGRFVSGTNFSDSVRAALSTGRWPSPPSVTPARRCETPAGRLGQERAIVPSGAVHLVVCTNTPQSSTARSLSTGFSGLVRALDDAKTRRSTNSCVGRPGPTSYVLVFSYARGPDVMVRIAPGCSPSIDNGGLASSDDTAVLRELNRVLGR